MRGLAIGLPLSIALWGVLIWAFWEVGWDAIAFLLIAGSTLYIIATIRRDWRQIAPDEWEAGDTTGYHDAPR